jgi:deazaflavin-dependent oxidoreductase (nitroreductase family)
VNRTQQINERNRQVIDAFRANAGRVDLTSPSGTSFASTLLLLTTTGAKSGLPRTNPLRYWQENGRVFVCASFQGAPKHPHWYLNLVANPRVTVEIGAEKYEARAKPISGPERDRLYALQVAEAPGFGEYQQRTKRVIPVVELVRV